MLAKIFKRKYELLVVSSLLLLGAIIYSNTFYSAFHFDDITTIVENSAIRNISNLQTIWNFWPTRFVTYFSIAFNYHISRLDVLSYHLFNLTVHLISAILVWRLMLLTFSAPVMKGQNITKHAKLIAVFTALVFLTHPIQTQAVTYIVQRAASLAALFYLLSLILYVKSRLLQQQGNKPKVSRLFYYGSLIAAVMAMFTKELAITLPFMALLYEICFLKRKERLNCKYLIPFFAALLIIPLTMFLTKSVDFTGMKRVLGIAPGISSRDYFLTQFRVIVTYLRLLFIPINQNLIYYYPVAKSLLQPSVLISLIFLCSVLTIAIKMFSNYRFISFGIFWFFLTLLPESSIIPIKDVIYEHRLYLPMVGFSFFLVSSIYYFFENKSLKSMIIVLLIIVSCYAMLTYRRNFIWKDELTLWSDVAQKSPKKAISYNNRGAAFREQGDNKRAFSDFNKAIEINPDYADAYNNRGNVYMDQGNIQQAFFDFNKAIEINPNEASYYYNRGNVYYYQGNYTEAIFNYKRAIKINPNEASYYYNRGVSYYKEKEYNNAWADVNKAESLGIKPDPKFLNDLKTASGR